MPSSELVIGIGATIVAALLLSTGSIIQALEVRRVDRDHGLRLSLLARFVRRAHWVGGTVVGYCAFPFEVFALQHAPLVVVQPLHVVGLLLASGVLVLRERLALGEAAGVAALVAGAAVVAWGAPVGPERGQLRGPGGARGGACGARPHAVPRP